VLNPVLQLLALRPAALAEHAEAYAQLAAAEAGDVLAAKLRLALLWASALCGVAVAAVLGGVAWMLAALQPEAAAPPWPLWAAPALPLALALLAVWAARRQQAGGTRPFAVLQAQWQIDRAWLRGDAAPPAAPPPPPGEPA
jgi:cytochrome bd-type quinol oxidase subunit 2